MAYILLFTASLRLRIGLINFEVPIACIGIQFS